MKWRLGLVSVGAVVVLTAAGCAANSDTSPTASADGVENPTAPNANGSAAEVGAADVAFAQGMIPHHQQAVEMADLALSPSANASPQVTELAEQIKGAQDPEIDQMTAWLQQWGEPTTMPGATGDLSGMDHSGHNMGGITMSGMMTADQLEQLQQTSGPAFDDMWLKMMIAHHEGAITMAEQVRATSKDKEVTTLANAIITAQRTEIQTMSKDQ